MKRYEKKTRTETYNDLVEVKCDLCGKVSNYTHGGDPNWSNRWNNYEFKETTIKYEVGTRYPEGGSSNSLSCDICPDCFVEKLVPWLESQGAKMMRTEIDY